MSRYPLFKRQHRDKQEYEGTTSRGCSIRPAHSSQLDFCIAIRLINASLEQSVTTAARLLSSIQCEHCVSMKR